MTLILLWCCVQNVSEMCVCVCFCAQVFKPDKMNGFDVQSDAEAMLERQRKDIMPRITSTPRTPATPAAALRFVFQPLYSTE